MTFGKPNVVISVLGPPSGSLETRKWGDSFASFGYHSDRLFHDLFYRQNYCGLNFMTFRTFFLPYCKGKGSPFFAPFCSAERAFFLDDWAGN